MLFRSQRARVKRAVGSQARLLGGGGDLIISEAPVSFGSEAHVTESGPYRFFAGIRSDPFFFDLLGFLAGFAFTGDDFFIDKNVFSIVLEVPNSALGSNPNVGIWSRCNKPVDGTQTQIDRMGRPAINTVFNHLEGKNIFNSITPDMDRTTLNEVGVTFEEDRKSVV